MTQCVSLIIKHGGGGGEGEGHSQPSHWWGCRRTTQQEPLSVAGETSVVKHISLRTQTHSNIRSFTVNEAKQALEVA